MSDAASFNRDLSRHRFKVRQRLKKVVDASADEIQKSITVGSGITGAPGSPVDTGELRGAWLAEYLSFWHWRTTNDKPYARFIEEGQYIQRSEVGGPHSVKLTRAALPRLLEAKARDLGPT